MVYHVQFDTCVWSLLDDEVLSDKTGKKERWKKSTIKLLELYEKEAKFTLSVSSPVLEELKKKPEQNKSALLFIEKHNFSLLEFDVSCGFILGSGKHGVLGMCPLGADVHPTSNLIDCDKRLSKDKQAVDRDILKHNINNEIDFLITTNGRDFNRSVDIKKMIKFPDGFLELLERRGS